MRKQKQNKSFRQLLIFNELNPRLNVLQDAYDIEVIGNKVTKDKIGDNESREKYKKSSR